MGSRKLIELRQPEGGMEHEVVYEIHHRCPQSSALMRLNDIANEDLDLLVFPVGNYGFAMPLNQVFACTAMDDCGACGRLITAMFVWRRGYARHAGHLWTPDGD